MGGGKRIRLGILRSSLDLWQEHIRRWCLSTVFIMLRVLFLHLLYLPINNGVTPLCLALTHVHKCCNIYVTNPLNAT